MQTISPRILLVNWEDLYARLGIEGFIHFITAPEIQADLLPAKIIFTAFSIFFFCAIIYFYRNSSFIDYRYFQNFADFLSWQSYGLRDMNKHWDRIEKKIKSGNESELKLSLVEADDLLYQMMEQKGYEGETFEELIDVVDKKNIPNFEPIRQAHEIRNSIVYDPDYRIDAENARQILSNYERAIKSLSMH